MVYVILEGSYKQHNKVYLTMFHFGGLNKHISSAEVTNIPTEGNNRCEHGVQVNNEVIDNGIKVRLSIYSQMEANQTFLML